MSPLSPTSSTFPTQSQVHRGVILGTIVHAVHNLAATSFHDDYYWEGHVLKLRDYNETRGCMSFRGGRIVGAFFFAESERSPLGGAVASAYDAMNFFLTASADVREIAREEVLPRMHDWVGGEQAFQDALQRGGYDQLPEWGFAPVITAALWSEDGLMAADEPWPETYLHGAHLLKLELLDSEVALGEWSADLELSLEQTALIRELFHRRLNATELPVVLTRSDYVSVRTIGTNHWASVCEQFAAVGIIVSDGLSEGKG